MTVINEAISNASCTFFGSSGGVDRPGVAASGSLWTISLENVISVLSGDGVTRVTSAGRRSRGGITSGAINFVASRH